VVVEDGGHVGSLIRDELLQLGDLADLLEGEDLISLVTVDGDTGGVVSSVFETGETWREMVSADCRGRRGGGLRRKLTVYECVNNEATVLLHEVVDVPENTTVLLSVLSLSSWSRDFKTAHHMMADGGELASTKKVSWGSRELLRSQRRVQCNAGASAVVV
jgi:hypothetical protein